MAEITVLQFMDMIEQNPSINNYQSRWRELRELLEKQAEVASQHRVQRTADGACENCGNNCWKLVCETCGAE